MSNNTIFKSNDDKNIDLLRVRSESYNCQGCYYHPDKTNCPKGKKLTCIGLRPDTGINVPFHFIPAFP